jgi:hypothetical protein
LEGREGSKDTIEHFREIFKNVYNSLDKEIIQENMHELRGRIRHVVFMIDEVTGDESGVEFLSRVAELLREYGFLNPSYNFSTKIIVADASLIGAEIIEQHVKNRQVEPDKIFYMRTTADKNLPITTQPFTYDTKDDACIINVNSFPAGEFWLHYRLAIGCPPFPEKKHAVATDYESKLPAIKGIINYQQRHLEEQVLTILRTTLQDQVIVYIQNKQRLRTLISSIDKKRLCCKNEGMMINSSLFGVEQRSVSS